MSSNCWEDYMLPTNVWRNYKKQGKHHSLVMCAPQYLTTSWLSLYEIGLGGTFLFYKLKAITSKELYEHFKISYSLHNYSSYWLPSLSSHSRSNSILHKKCDTLGKDSCERLCKGSAVAPWASLQTFPYDYHSLPKVFRTLSDHTKHERLRMQEHSLDLQSSFKWMLSFLAF